MFRTRLTIVVVGVLLAGAAVAEEPKKMDIIDFLVDGKDMVGKTVTITGCKFLNATSSSVTCHSAKGQGFTPVDAKSLQDKEDLRKALKACGGFNDTPACQGSVTGIVKNTYGMIELVKAKINWGNGKVAEDLGEIDGQGNITRPDGTIIRPDGSIKK